MSRRPQLLTVARLGLAPDPVRADRRDGMAGYLRATLDTQLRALLRHQRDAGADDLPEAVHQMRVAARRMRVALRMGQPAAGPVGVQLRAELAWLGGALGPVRDLDVLSGRLRAETPSLGEADLPAFDELLAALARIRADAREDLLAALGDRRYRALLRALADQANAPLPKTNGKLPDPRELVRRPLRKLYREYAELGADPDEEALHALRIRAKRVRYAAELAARLTDKRLRTRLDKLVGATRNLQDVLGEHHDTVVGEQRLRELADDAGELSPAALMMAGRLVERELAHRADRARAWPIAWTEVDRRVRKLN